MKNILLGFLFLISLSNLNAKTFSKEASSTPILVQKGEEKYWCPVCGLNIKKYYKTSYTAKLNNGTPRQYCSLSCLIKDKNTYGLDINSIKVIDAKNEKLIKAQDAFFVIGSKIKGTMSQTSKLAFEKEEDAKTFIKKYNGELITFNEALKRTQKSYENDFKKIKNKRIKKIYPKGKRIFEKVCSKDIDFTNYLEINELKADIINNKLCKKLDEKKLQTLALYLWEVKRNAEDDKNINSIKVEKNEKCPVCGMFVSKYPRWVAQIFYKHEDHEHKFSFDGVKDLMKFYFNPKKWGDYPVKKELINKILVTDYYSQEAIDGTKAYYVIGSDVYGPMGNELIPFLNKDDAIIFKNDHQGKKIIKFENILEADVYKLDE